MNAVKIAETAMRTRYVELSFGKSFTSLDLLIAVKIINAMKYAIWSRNRYWICK